MRVRGILTCLALSAALSALSPSAQAASKPRPTPPKPTFPLKTLKAHQTCTKSAVQGTKLCFRAELKQVTNAKKQTMTYVTLVSYETRGVRGLSIVFAATTPDGKSQIVGGCQASVSNCGSMLLNANRYTQVRARLLDSKHGVLLETSAIHLPLR